jgi:hypothetical protein
MNKVLFNVILFTGMVAAIISGIANYLKGSTYAWQAISLMWMIAHYSAYRYISFLEKELDRK